MRRFLWGWVFGFFLFCDFALSNFLIQCTFVLGYIPCVQGFEGSKSELGIRGVVY